MKRYIGTILLVVMAAMGLTACGSEEASAATAVCVDQSGNRVEDSQCGGHDYYHNNGMSAYEWYFIASMLNQPSVGSQVVHNTYYSSTKSNPYAGYKAPQTVQIAKGVPKTGWTASSNSKSFVPKDKSNVTPPKVIQQAPKPMYQPKAPINKPPVYKAPAPRR